VPLCDRAVTILEEMRGDKEGDLVFSFHRGRRLNHNTMRDVLKRMGVATTVHGFRSTFRDWAAEQSSFPADVIEVALAHTVGSKVQQAYFRSDLFEKRRRLMDDWARHCAGPQLAKVIKLR
jgi:integrase